MAEEGGLNGSILFPFGLYCKRDEVGVLTTLGTYLRVVCSLNDCRTQPEQQSLILKYALV